MDFVYCLQYLFEGRLEFWRDFKETCGLFHKQTLPSISEMNISDTFYVALCMTILIIGVVYWFWTQNQYIQRKLNLLENIVYEMKTSLNNAPEPTAINKVEYPPAPSSELGEDDDILHEELHAEVSSPLPQDIQEVISSEQANEEPVQFQSFDDTKIPDDLQPGGSSISVDLPADSTGSSLDSMTLKELKRLAEQRKISGASNMRKQALIDALRNNVTKDTEPFIEANVAL